MKSAAILLMIGLASVNATAQSAPPRKDIPSIAKAANGSIVSIVMSDGKKKPIAQGTGFVVTKAGLIVTNYHVIAEGSSAVAKLPDGAIFVLEGVVASDKARDVAIVKATGKNFRKLTLGNSDQVEVGQEVVAIGNPRSLESTVSNGIVSGIRTAEELGGKFLQVTAPISPGSSGGPLFNMAGEVIGITTLYLKVGENLNFAIPINDAKRLLADTCAQPGVTPPPRFVLDCDKTAQAWPDEIQPTDEHANDQEVTLSDTLHWMATTLDQYGFMHNDSRFDQKIADNHGEACRLFVNGAVLNGQETPHRVYHLQMQFHLANMDPDSVGVRVPARSEIFEVHVETTNSEPLIWASSSNWREDKNVPEYLQYNKVRWFAFQLRDQKKAEKFSVALKHAIQLCGGKPSTF